jgi:outer membrane protein OmpA-like peptidoglycan-associated protein
MVVHFKHSLRSRGVLAIAIVALVTLVGRPADAQDSRIPRLRDAAQPAQSSPPTKVPLEVTLDKSKVDLREHHLELTPSRNLTKVTIKVTGDSGAVLADEARDLPPHPARTPLIVRWTPSSDEPAARIEVFVYDAEGFYRGIALTPWSVSIPHEDVNFKTASAQIDDSEAPKLEASFAKVSEALAKHPEIQATLFIAGHTDTVGDAASNFRLSRQRALSIAAWFRHRGLKISIACEGFGESSLLVKTADEVDEPRNRRADYILGADEPTIKTVGFRPSWVRVP